MESPPEPVAPAPAVGAVLEPVESAASGLPLFVLVEVLVDVALVVAGDVVPEVDASAVGLVVPVGEAVPVAWAQTFTRSLPAAVHVC